MNLRNATICIFVVTSLIGCGGDDDDPDQYDSYYYDDYAYTTWYWNDWMMDPMYAMTDPFEDPYYYYDFTFLKTSDEAPLGDPEAAAQLVADSAEQYFTPAECARVTRSGSELSFALASCNGPFAVGTIDGTLRVVFLDDDGQIAFEVTSQDLMIDGVNAELDANVVYSATDGTKKVRYTAQGSLGRETPYSGEFDGMITWTAGSNCVTRDTRGQVTADAGTADVEIAGYTRCGRECPTAGVLTVSDDRGMASLTFDGSERATLERADGEREELSLDCD
jgi:hypothetical protein